MSNVQKWGNSLAIRIPAAVAAQLDLSAGVPVELSAEAGALVVRPVRRGRLQLQDLLKNCRPEQLHGELDLGDDVGRECVE